MTQWEPLLALDAQRRSEESCPPPDWHALVARWKAERIANGLPPEPCLLPTLMDLASRMDARRARKGGAE